MFKGFPTTLITEEFSKIIIIIISGSSNIISIVSIITYLLI